jgi:phosphomannomutase
MEKRLLPEFPGRRVARVSYSDGCKVYFEDGAWVIVRFSGTEPLLRIFSEAASGEEAGELVRIMKDFSMSV